MLMLITHQCVTYSIKAVLKNVALGVKKYIGNCQISHSRSLRVCNNHFYSENFYITLFHSVLL